MIKTDQKIYIKTNEHELKKSLRFAFANHDTCVQELIQNSRRAGATHVFVEYDEAARVLTVRDDGAGVADLQKMLTIGQSDWSDEVAHEESPYGLGFLSAIFSATEVSITSGKWMAGFNAASALAGAPVSTLQLDIAAVGTKVVLKGFEWSNFNASIKRMALGYPIPLIFNGLALHRPNAVGMSVADSAAGSEAGFVSTPVGLVRLNEGNYDPENFTCYLQGFPVYEADRLHSSVSRHIVHLDTKVYRGKIPDRDRVIDEVVMLAQVKQTLKQLYVERLDEMRRKLPAIEFVSKGYQLARKLGMLEVFNDVPWLSNDWLTEFNAMPCSGERSAYETVVDERIKFSMDKIVSGEIKVVRREMYDANAYCGSIGEKTNLQILLGWCLGAYTLKARLDPGHWIYRHLAVDAKTQVELSIVDQSHRVPVNHRHVTCAGDAELVLCDKVGLIANGQHHQINDSMGAIVDGQALIIVPRGSDGQRLSSSIWALRQAVEYHEEGSDGAEDLCEADDLAIDAMVRHLEAGSPKERAQLTLARALQNFTELNGMDLQISVSKDGQVTVHEATESAAEAGGEAAE